MLPARILSRTMPNAAFVASRHHRPLGPPVCRFLSKLPTQQDDTTAAVTSETDTDSEPNSSRRTRSKNASRFRQHVNPLARKFQIPIELSENWPSDVFIDVTLPLFLDIGCGKGGFLCEMAKTFPDVRNYLGLEIRPSVAEFARERIVRRGLSGRLDFLGCNANVDLDRLLCRHQEAGGGPLEIVTIQFPDPHFKKQHTKRRVVTPELVLTLAKFMSVGSTVFLQSDVQPVLDYMRERFRDYPQYFRDERESLDEYLDDNIIGIPTEREVSVLKNDLPVYRSVFRRTAEALDETLLEDLFRTGRKQSRASSDETPTTTE